MSSGRVGRCIPAASPLAAAPGTAAPREEHAPDHTREEPRHGPGRRRTVVGNPPGSPILPVLNHRGKRKKSARSNLHIAIFSPARNASLRLTTCFSNACMLASDRATPRPTDSPCHPLREAAGRRVVPQPAEHLLDPPAAPPWVAMNRLSVSMGACPNSSFGIVAGAGKSTRIAAVARPMINRINTIWAANMVVPPQLHRMNGRAPPGAHAHHSPLLAAIALDHLNPLLPHPQTPPSRTDLKSVPKRLVPRPPVTFPRGSAPPCSWSAPRS
jgi:hypothetical protein